MSLMQTEIALRMSLLGEYRYLARKESVLASYTPEILKTRERRNGSSYRLDTKMSKEIRKSHRRIQVRERTLDTLLQSCLEDVRLRGLQDQAFQEAQSVSRNLL
jgi:hypothetical protein